MWYNYDLQGSNMPKIVRKKDKGGGWVFAEGAEGFCV